jgi:polyisoprenoid-binding protein YceI
MSASVPAPGKYSIDPSHTTIEFVARHMMVTKVKGRFTDVSGTILVGDSPADHSVEVSIDPASIDTRDQKRDEHLRSPDFLDVENNKEFSFRSTSVEPSGSNWKLTGDLTLHGVTKPVSLDLEYTGAGTNPWGVEVAGFEASTEINRKDWGLEWNVALETGGVLVSEKVQISLDVQAQKEG